MADLQGKTEKVRRRVASRCLEENPQNVYELNLSVDNPVMDLWGSFDEISIDQERAKLLQ